MKLLQTFILCILITLVFSISAFAYIDPSILAYVIQAGAGILIAIGAGVALHFHRVKRKMNETLKIDKNKNMEVEEDVVVFDEDDNKK